MSITCSTFSAERPTHYILSSLLCCGLSSSEKIHDTLISSQSLLHKLGQTGPLMSLVLAANMRDDLLRLNRDLSAAFHTLGTGENLMVSYKVTSFANDVTRNRTESVLLHPSGTFCYGILIMKCNSCYTLAHAVRSA